MSQFLPGRTGQGEPKPIVSGKVWVVGADWRRFADGH
jgi:hypothetical protein